MTKIKKDWRDRFNDVVSDWERAAEVNMCAALYGAIEDFIDQALKQQREEILEYLGMEKLDLIDFDMRSNCDLNWAKGYAVCREKLNAKIKEIRGGKMKKNFIRFKECNSWEGETWNFYIPVEGNEKAIKRLAKILEKYPSYTLYPIPLSEKEVDILVKNIMKLVIWRGMIN